MSYVSCDSKVGIELNLYLLRKDIESLTAQSRCRENYKSRLLRECREIAESIVADRKRAEIFDEINQIKALIEGMK